MTDSAGPSILSGLAKDPSVQKLQGLAAGVRRQLSRRILLVDFSDGCAVVAQCRLRRGGTVDLRFLRPVRPGDTVTFTGKITGLEKEANGTRVRCEISASNQKGDTTAAGSGACLVPSGYLPAEE